MSSYPLRVLSSLLALGAVVLVSGSIPFECWWAVSAAAAQEPPASQVEDATLPPLPSKDTLQALQNAPPLHTLPKASSLDDAPSPSRRFLRLFQEKRGTLELNPIGNAIEETHPVRAGGVTLFVPEGWSLQQTQNPRIALRLVHDPNPGTRIEVRRSKDISRSKLGLYLDSILAQLERDGFKALYDDASNLPSDIETIEGSEAATEGGPRLRQFAGLEGLYVRLGVSPTTKGRLQSMKDLEMLLFLYEAEEEAWIFTLYSSNGKAMALEPMFQDLLSTVQFDLRKSPLVPPSEPLTSPVAPDANGTADSSSSSPHVISAKPLS